MDVEMRYFAPNGIFLNGYRRINYWGKILEVPGEWRNYTIRSVIICTHLQIGCKIKKS
jgi:hypothetical protein